MNMQRLTTVDAAQWTRIVEQCHPHDFYHSAQYHALAEDSGEGTAFLFHYSECAYTIAAPLIFRSLPEVLGLSAAARGWQDATSVYGYAGPIASHTEIPEQVIRNFQASLERELRGLGIVSLFSRLHPLLERQNLIAGLGELRTMSRTVSVDLTLPLEEQRAQLRTSFKVRINKLRRMGITCLHDRAGAYLDAFIEIYTQTMRRVGASPMYFFPRAYFQKLARDMGDKFHLVVCLDQGEVLAGGIFIESSEMLQYHLGGTRDTALPLAPMKLLLDDTRIWATGRGLKVFHLGGGATTDPEDPLLHFKLGFSHRTHEFMVWRWILLEDVYRQLCAEKIRWNQQRGLGSPNPDFFPAYRASTPPVMGDPERIGQTEHAGTTAEVHP